MSSKIFNNAMLQDSLFSANEELLIASRHVDDPEISLELKTMADKVEQYLKLAESEGRLTTYRHPE